MFQRGEAMNLALLTLIVPLQQAATLELTVDGTKRSALVYASRETRSSAPLVFVFHGFSGNARQAARSYDLHGAWPEAVVVYPQGLTIESPRLQRTGPGWQHSPGEQGDRDLKFFDALLGKVKADYKIDPKRVYVCGMSNGALFSFLLLARRADSIAAFAPIAGGAGLWLRDAKTPRPVLMVHGKNDTLVPLRGAELTRDACIRLNGAVKQEREWAPGYTLYKPPSGNNVVVWRLHEGGHIWPAGTTEMIVRFFKEHALP
jgi:polyhydroxybutyrate depolymerase